MSEESDESKSVGERVYATLTDGYFLVAAVASLWVFVGLGIPICEMSQAFCGVGMGFGEWAVLAWILVPLGWWGWRRAKRELGRVVRGVRVGLFGYDGFVEWSR